MDELHGAILGVRINLRAYGIKLPDWQLAQIFIRGLPETYDEMLNRFDGSWLDFVTYEDVFSAALRHENMLNL